MSFRFVDHTAELQLEIEAPTRVAVFSDAVRALADLLAADEEPGGPLQVRELSVEATDDPTLLAAWLDEILFLAETEGLVPLRAERLDAGAAHIHGAVSFAGGAPPHLVKGVTYHDLTLSHVGGIWHGRVVLDV